MPPLTPDELRSFLHFGFVPRVPPELDSKPWFRRPAADEPGSADSDDEGLLARGIEAFLAACADTRGELHVVPLSGGLDSRLILGVLLRLGLGPRLIAVTFGTPGTLDFELGRAVARFAGVRHEAIDLTTVDTRVERLAESVPTGRTWVPILEAHYNREVPRRFGPGAVYWSGLMANTLNGSRCWPERESTWADACARFASEGRMARSVDLCPGYRAESALPREPLAPGSRLTFTEQLYLGVKYPSWFEPCLLVPGFDYRQPFRHPRWVEFSLSLSVPVRRDERFFRRMSQRLCPELFRLPTKNQLGLPLAAPAWRVFLERARNRAGKAARRSFPRLVRAAPRNTNYVDLEGELRRASGLRTSVRSLLDDLGARRLVEGVDLERLWLEHVRWRANHGVALTLLASLELQLAVRERAAKR